MKKIVSEFYWIFVWLAFWTTVLIACVFYYKMDYNGVMPIFGITLLSFLFGGMYMMLKSLGFSPKDFQKLPFAENHVDIHYSDDDEGHPYAQIDIHNLKSGPMRIVSAGLFEYAWKNVDGNDVNSLLFRSNAGIASKNKFPLRIKSKAHASLHVGGEWFDCLADPAGVFYAVDLRPYNDESDLPSMDKDIWEDEIPENIFIVRLDDARIRGVFATKETSSWTMEEDEHEGKFANKRL